MARHSIPALVNASTAAERKPQLSCPKAIGNGWRLWASPPCVPTQTSRSESSREIALAGLRLGEQRQIDFALNKTLLQGAACIADKRDQHVRMILPKESQDRRHRHADHVMGYAEAHLSCELHRPHLAHRFVVQRYDAMGGNRQPPRYASVAPQRRAARKQACGTHIPAALSVD